MEDELRVELTGESDLLGKTQADFVKDLGFVLGGTVYGTFKYVTGFTNFNASVPEEQEGYYLPFKVVLPDGATSAQFKNKNKENWVDVTSDMLCLFHCGHTLQSLRQTKIEIKTDNGVLLELDLSNVYVE